MNYISELEVLDKKIAERKATLKRLENDIAERRNDVTATSMLAERQLADLAIQTEARKIEILTRTGQAKSELLQLEAATVREKTKLQQIYEEQNRLMAEKQMKVTALEQMLRDKNERLQDAERAIAVMKQTIASL